ncbi:MAG: DEAD/DEAH box helicase [Bacteroidetes bacterium 4572_128]|nr:MAG: DEAD/DEAH box helicase [Bacteroidetes bacterium 4572_128]
MKTFEELGLNSEILKAIEDLGFESPTLVQDKTIDVLLNSNKDLVVLSQTGTGKTAAFGFPLIQKIEKDTKKPQTLILCPTRELCIQIAKDLKSYAKYTENFNIVAVYGGSSIEKQMYDLKSNVQMVVGTPGRTLDLIKRKKLNVSEIKYLILDEADEMFNMGFKEELNSILEKTPDKKQNCLFTATMPKEAYRIASKYMDNPEEIVAGKKNIGAINVNHVYYMVQAKDRYKALKRIADVNPNIYGIIFCRTRRETKDIADKLMGDGYNADALHGDLSQAQRDYVMHRFRVKNLQILVATDVAARGLDVEDLTHIINYNMPDDPEAYIHRSGRTGRAGKKGTSISIIHTRSMNKIRELEKKVSQKFERNLIPIGEEICEKQLFNLIDKVEKIKVDEKQIEKYLPIIYKKLDWLNREDLIKHFVSVEFNHFLEYYKNAVDLNVQIRKDRNTKDGKENSRHSSENFSRFYINIGSVNKLVPVRLIGLINERLKKRDVEIGKIEILKKFSFFEVDKNFEDQVLDTFKNYEFEGNSLIVELSKEKKGSQQDGNFRKRNFKKNDSFKRNDRFKKDDGFKRNDRFKKDEGFKRTDRFKKDDGFKRTDRFKKDDGFKRTDRFKKDDGFKKNDRFKKDDGFKKDNSFNEE